MVSPKFTYLLCLFVLSSFTQTLSAPIPDLGEDATGISLFLRSPQGGKDPLRRSSTSSTSSTGSAEAHKMPNFGSGSSSSGSTPNSRPGSPIAIVDPGSVRPEPENFDNPKDPKIPAKAMKKLGIDSGNPTAGGSGSGGLLTVPGTSAGGDNNLSRKSSKASLRSVASSVKSTVSSLGGKVKSVAKTVKGAFTPNSKKKGPGGAGGAGAASGSGQGKNRKRSLSFGDAGSPLYY